MSEFNKLEGEAEKFGEREAENKLGMGQQGQGQQGQGQQGQDQYGQGQYDDEDQQRQQG